MNSWSRLIFTGDKYLNGMFLTWLNPVRLLSSRPAQVASNESTDCNVRLVKTINGRQCIRELEFRPENKYLDRVMTY